MNRPTVPTVDALHTQALPPEQRRHVVRLVASVAEDVEDCALLLAVLGLDAADGLTDDRR
ncbi:hypothetical protein VSH64_16700 [Amycolatopsis rhabdoformis]|uniref:Uncharacterized protein n=1 Tax=Amycolatopsis rhabdoformis TaxID=1448059 RepID=A0ABZ1IHY3_9PSEU|nr:hypothetical protein [Amycolatopsis rhabdoformis]WSE33726.1 hypothetical protein VSH64_16700 [Amycolatopsis rhabdoformis]